MTDNVFTPAEILEALQDKYDITSNVVVVNLCEPNTTGGVTLETIRPKEAPLDLTCLGLASMLDDVIIKHDMLLEYGEYTVSITKPKEQKTRQLKRLSQLKGLTIVSVKAVKKATKYYIKTADGAGICVQGAVVVQDLHADENIALGLLTKADLASIAKAKKMGLIL